MKQAIILTLIFLWAFVFGGYCYYFSRIAIPDKVAERHIAAQQKALDRVPTIEEIQRKIGAKEDGIVGPNTITLWEKAINQQYADEIIARMEKE